jgi:hypothetical protein
MFFLLLEEEQQVDQPCASTSSRGCNSFIEIHSPTSNFTTLINTLCLLAFALRANVLENIPTDLFEV